MPTDFTLRAGIPFARQIRLADGKNVWPDLDTAEVRCQLREGRHDHTRLIANLHEYMTTAFDDNDIVISWSMTGADTHSLTEGGSYDLVISDVGAADQRAIPLLDGQIKVKATVTSATDDA